MCGTACGPEAGKRLLVKAHLLPDLPLSVQFNKGEKLLDLCNAVRFAAAFFGYNSEKCRWLCLLRQ